MDLLRFNELLDKAQGNRSQNQFALHCGISSAALTRFRKGERAPTPRSLKLIAERAHNGVTYEMLMTAAGYIDDSSTTSPFSDAKLKEFEAGLKDLNLEQYKSLTDDDKALIASQFNALIDRLKDKK